MFLEMVGIEGALIAYLERNKRQMEIELMFILHKLIFAKRTKELLDYKTAFLLSQNKIETPPAARQKCEVVKV